MEASSHDTAHQELTEVHGEGEGMPAFACGLNLVVTSVRCPSHLKSVHVSRDHAGICFSDLLRGYSFRTFEGRLNWNMPGDNGLLWLRTRQTGNLFVSIEAQVNVLQLLYFWVNFPDLINTIILVMQKYFKLMLIHFHFRELHSLYLIYYINIISVLPCQLVSCASVPTFFGTRPNPVTKNDNPTIKMSLGGIYKRIKLSLLSH